jgi:hypothetical protein
MNDSSDAIKGTELKTLVDYWPGNTAVGRIPAVLTTENGILRLLTVDESGTPTGDTIFESPVAAISKVRGTLVLLQFYVKHTRYNVQFTRASGHHMSLGGVAAGVQEINGLDTKKWADYLHANGVDVKTHGWGWSLAVGLGIAALIIGSGVGYAVIMTAITG